MVVTLVEGEQGIALQKNGNVVLMKKGEQTLLQNDGKVWRMMGNLRRFWAPCFA